MRFEQALDDHGKLDARTWIRGEELLPNGNIKHASKYPEFLVYGSWLYRTSLVIAAPCFRSDVLAKTFAKK
jgi:hypothetical protein